MKICHILWSLTTGGIETMLINIINEQVKTDSVMLVVVNDLVDPALLQQISPDCRVVLLRRKAGSRNPLSILRLNALIARWRPDVIHHHSPRTSRLIFTRRPMVRTIHNTNLAADEYPRMDALYAISRSVQEFTAAQGFDSVVVMNGIPAAAIARKVNYDRADGLFHIVQVGRLLFSQKGQDLAVEAMDELVNRRGIKDIRLHFIGDGEDRDALEALIAQKGLGEYVIIEGLKSRDYLFGHLKDYDLFLQPSRFEGFGLTVAEACAAGLPVLISELEGPYEIIDGGRYGMTFRSCDISDMADQIEKICRDGYDDAMIDGAYRRVMEHYDVGATARAYLDEYRKLVNVGRNA